jgi:uncharacterized phage-associated protein
MAHVQDAAAFILCERGPLTAMQVHKLCYYSYGYHLAWEGRPLFPERFQAWANGPISPVLYRFHQGCFMLSAGDLPGDPDSLDDGERESVRLVLGSYGHLTAHQLSLMTHREHPWRSARARAKVAPLERSTVQIRDADIHEYFDILTAVNADAETEEG